jgi:tyrosyl-tRNA synthetase
MTGRVHGADVARSVVEASRLLFGGMELKDATADVLKVLAQELPVARVPRAEVIGMSVLDALVRSGLATSKGDARRGIQGKGFILNGETIAAPERTLGENDVLPGAFVMLQKGKRNHALIALE